MKETKCEAVRRELEELMLGDECSSGATQHLRECGQCAEFHQKQTKLRQIVGGLGTVEAPPDFDFRLRARLANESSAAGFHLRSMQWSFASRGFAAAAMLIVFVGGVVYVRTVVNGPAEKEMAQRKDEPAQQAPVQPAPKPPEETVLSRDDAAAPVAFESGPRKFRPERQVPSKARPSIVSADFASERAEVISNSQRQSPIFPLDASLQSFKVSLDDGSGNERTISVPALTFGSQRVLPAGNQFVQQKGGVW
jgi:hypothetical protein